MDEQRVKFEKSYSEWESEQDERAPCSYKSAYAAGYEAAREAVSGISDTAEFEKLAAALIKAIMHCSTTPLMIRRMVPILRAWHDFEAQPIPEVKR